MNIVQTTIIFNFVPDQLKTRKMCKHEVKKLPFEIRYIPNGYKTKKVCGKAILENGVILQYSLFLNDMILKKYVTKLLIDVFCICCYSRLV